MRHYVYAFAVLAMTMVFPFPSSFAAEDAPADGTRDTVVVLLHGIGHTRWNMLGVEIALRRAGYETVNISYPSRRKNIQYLAEFVYRRLEKEGVWKRPGRVHFVTHSMGGLVARRMLEEHRQDIPPEKTGRLAMIAPPNGGSEVADFLKDFPPYFWAFGPAGQELTTAARQADTSHPYYETGIIAGSKSWPYIVARFVVPGAHDGRVTVEKTKLEGMKDHITLNATHSFISWRPDTHAHIVAFLREGSFRKKE